MPASGPSAPLLCVLVCVSVCVRALQRSELRLAYVTQHSLYYCTCVRDPHPCSLLSPADCSCKDLPLSTLHHPQPHSSPPLHLHASSHASSPVFRARRLTVWYTSPSNAAHLLNNSEVRHLTLIRCGPGGSRAPSLSQEGNFAVQHLERLTVAYLQWKPAPDRDRDNRNTDSNTDPETERGGHRDTDRHTDEDRGDGDTNMDSEAPALTPSSPQIQDIFLGRELGAAYHEQARLGIIHSSVLEWGAAVKAYTVQTHIDSNGALPFPNLHLSKLPETSSIYVSFIY
uniref:uncharacterized protein n=1 Tax=Centroberyx gerrardi TaxID=166262 RepID=UPI003AAA2EB4